MNNHRREAAKGERRLVAGVGGAAGGSGGVINHGRGGRREIAGDMKGGPRERAGVEVHVLCAVEYKNEASFTHAKVFTEQPRHFSSLDGVLLARFSRGLAEAELRGHKMR